MSTNEPVSKNDYAALALLHQASYYLHSSGLLHSEREVMADHLEDSIEAQKERLAADSNLPHNLIEILVSALETIRYGGDPKPVTEALDEAIEAIYPYERVQAAFGRMKDDLLLIADLDAVPPQLITELLAALDELHRAHGGGGLIIRTSTTGSAALVGVRA